MIKNYFKIALRHLWRDKQTTFIHLFGFSFAFAGVIFILLFVRNEMGVDTWHEKSDRTFKLTLDETVSRPDGRHLATVAPPVAGEMKAMFPEVEEAVRLRYSDDVVFESNGQQFYENKVWYADSAFFKIFDFKLKYGDPNVALVSPNSIVITPSVAQKYFGNENPIGKSIQMNETTLLNVTGVLANEPTQTHFDFKTLISFSTFRVPVGYPVTLESWGWASFHTYVQLAEGTSPELLEQKFSEFNKKHYAPERANIFAYRLQPLEDIYLNSSNLINSQWMKSGNLNYIWGLTSIAFFILFIASFNFMNINAARSIRREREVGIRKVLGAGKFSIFRQFSGEAVLIVLVSMILSIGWFIIGKNSLQNLLGWNFELQTIDYFLLLPALGTGAIIIGIAAGAYPAFLLSKFKIVQSLKEKTRRGKSGQMVQRTLLVLQFAIAAGLISATILIQQQLQFLQNQNLGFDSENVVSLQMRTNDFHQRFQLAKQLFSQNNYVSSISAGETFDGNYGSVPVYYDQIESTEAPTMRVLGTFSNYFKTLGIEMAEGREFSEMHPTDSTSSIILNETAVKTLGLKDPIGKTISVSNIKTGQIVGVVKDFHFKSLHDPIEPLAVFVPDGEVQHILLRLKPGNPKLALASLQDDWKKIAPDLPFDLTFVDHHIQQNYLADRQFANMISLFTMLTILVTCLGLYGLISLMIQYRQKELSIRKVLGAPFGNLIWLTTKRYLLPTLLALVIAVPFTWWAMQNFWLNNFAYRIEINWKIFVLAGVMTIALTCITVSFQSFKAAVANPVDAIRND